jgi:Haem-binding domain
MKKNLIVLASVGLVGFLLIQLVPYRISNPSIRREPKWDSPRTRALAVRACFDCHSNETKTPFYGKIAPVSWWLTNHVKEGRAALNFSEWNGNSGRRREHDAGKTVLDGSMPPSYFTWLGLHSNAKLSAQEKQELAAGLRLTLGDSEGGGGD